MDKYGTGIEVRQVIIDETAPPDEVRAAFDDVIKAREDEIRYKNEADAYANQIIPVARGQAEKILQQAQGYEQRVVAESKGEAERFNKLYAQYKRAPQVTRDRMYLDAMQDIYTNSSKVVVDIKNGNNLLYLPLDKLMSGADSGPSLSNSSSAAMSDSGGGSSSSAAAANDSSRPASRRDSDR